MITELETLKQIAKGISLEFGNDCEVIIFDMSIEDIKKSIVFIENGHVSGRSIGDGPLNELLNDLKGQNNSDPKDKHAFLIRTKSGRTLKSTVLFIKDDHNSVRYILSINYDITNILAVQNSIKNITDTNYENKALNSSKQITNVNSLLDELIEQAAELIGIPAALMTKEDKIRFINYLNDAGAFLITRSGDRVSEFLGISKYTLYNYVNINK